MCVILFYRWPVNARRERMSVTTSADGPCGHLWGSMQPSRAWVFPRPVLCQWVIWGDRVCWGGRWGRGKGKSQSQIPVEVPEIAAVHNRETGFNFELPCSAGKQNGRPRVTPCQGRKEVAHEHLLQAERLHSAAIAHQVSTVYGALPGSPHFRSWKRNWVT